MTCEMCNEEVHKQFGEDRDYVVGGTVEYLDAGRTKWRTVEHILCRKCYREWLRGGQKRNTILT